jgi:hypothetical protein
VQPAPWPKPEKTWALLFIVNKVEYQQNQNYFSKLRLTTHHGETKTNQAYLTGVMEYVSELSFGKDVNFQKDGCKRLDYVLTCSDGIFDKLST